jgi:hypothetical protein
MRNPELALSRIAECVRLGGPTTSVGGVLLKAAPLFALTRPEDVFGCLDQAGLARSLAEMDAGIAAEVKRRHARNRY